MNNPFYLFAALSGVVSVGYLVSKIYRLRRKPDSSTTSNSGVESEEVQIVQLSEIAQIWCGPESNHPQPAWLRRQIDNCRKK